MMQWRSSSDGSRWRLEESAERDVLVVSFASWTAARAGIAARVAKGAVHLDTEDQGRVVARFRLPALTNVH
jgi:hypothetical protein